MTVAPVDIHRQLEIRKPGFLSKIWDTFLLALAGLVVTGFWIFVFFVILPLMTG